MLFIDCLLILGLRVHLGGAVEVCRPVHSYHLGRAEADGVVLDVLADYACAKPPKGYPSPLLERWPDALIF